jgi:hypothetical protein
MDVFDFTAKETAEFLSNAESAVQVAIGRARARLKKLASVNEDNQPALINVAKQKTDQSGLLFKTRNRYDLMLPTESKG